MKKYIIISLFIALFSSFNVLACSSDKCDHDSDCDSYRNQHCSANQVGNCSGAHTDEFTHKKTGCKGTCMCKNVTVE